MGACLITDMTHTARMTGGKRRPAAMYRFIVIAVVLVGTPGCEMLPGRDDFEDRAFITNETDEAVVIHWFDAAGEEERIFELAPNLPPGGQIDLPECDPRGLVARTTSGEEVARRDGPTCGGWVVTDER